MELDQAKLTEPVENEALYISMDGKYRRNSFGFGQAGANL